MASLISKRGLLLGAAVASIAYYFQDIIPPTFPDTPVVLSAKTGGLVDARETCQRVKGPDLVNCEDGFIWKEYDLVIMSCDPDRGNWNTVMGPLKDSKPRGNLHVYSLNTSSLYTLPLTNFPPEADFRPLGIAIGPISIPAFANPARLLHVINHRRDYSTIELFELTPPTSTEPAKINYLRTLRHPLIWAPNGIAPVTPYSFFFTNDHWASRRWPVPIFLIHILETLLKLPTGSVAFAKHGHTTPDSLEVRTVQRFIPFANGIALVRAANKYILAVAGCMAYRVEFYVADLIGPKKDSWPALEHHSSVHVGASVDNLHVVGGESGTGAEHFGWTTEPETILASGHPNPLRLLQVARNPWDREKVYSGSRSFKVAFGVKEAEQVFLDSGKWFRSSASGLAKDDGRFLLLGLYEDGIADCQGVDVKVK